MTARPTTGAGHPTPENEHMTDSDYEQIIDLVQSRKIRRNDRWQYVNTTTGRVMDDLVYAAADDQRGYLYLRRDGAVKVTPKGRQWRRRDVPAVASPFHTPAGVA
jgi:hypothetical protein